MIERTIIGTNTDNSNQAYTRRFINRGLLLISGAKLHQLLKTAKKNNRVLAYYFKKA